MIKAVIFDVGGVFLLPSGDRQAAVIEAATGFPAHAEQCRDAWTRAMAAVDQEIAAGSDQWEALAGLDLLWMSYSGVPDHLAEAAMEAVWAENRKPRSLWSELVPGGREALETIAATGLRLGCVSNSDGRVERELNEDRLAGLFEVIVDSHVVGVAKPDPRIFAICLERMGGLEPEECLYVGDTLAFDVAGATAAGLRPCHFDRLDIYGRPPDGLRRIRSLAELP